MGSLVFLSTVERPLALDILSLINHMIQLGVSYFTHAFSYLVLSPLCLSDP